MKKALLVVAALSMVGYGLYRWRGGEAPSVNHDSLLEDRLWIDHIPRSERDTIQVFVAFTEQPIGMYQATSVWKGQYEGFRYEGHGGELRVVFPQNGDREKLRVRATTCNTGGMDYCLELSGSSRGVKKYYSRKGWEIDSVRDVDGLIAKLAI